MGNFISRHIAGFGEVGTYIYRYFIYMSSPNSNMPDRKRGGGILKVKMAVVNPEAASVTTTRDSSLKIRLNQITKQTTKRIISDLSLSLFFSIRRTLNLQSIKSLQMIFYFTLQPSFSGRMFGVKLFLLSVNSALLFCPEASRNCFTTQGIISVFKNIFTRHNTNLTSDQMLYSYLLSPIML